MKLKKHYRTSGTLISAAGLALSVLGIMAAQNFVVGADSASLVADADYAVTMLFVGGVIVIAGFIVIILAFFSD